MKAAHVPEKTGFATKPALAARMIERALTAQVPFAWAAADTVYGVGALETVLRRAGKGYVLGVSSDHRVQSWGKKQAIAGSAEAIAQSLAPSDWLRLSAGEGTKGARLHDWAYCELADLDAGEYDQDRSGTWTRGLLIRRNIADGDLAFFSTWCPAGTPVQTLVKVEGHRGPIRDLDARPADPAQHRRWRSGLFLDMVSSRDAHPDAGEGGRPSLGHRGQLRDRQERARPRP
jgi:SRSO17 transposase